MSKKLFLPLISLILLAIACILVDTDEPPRNAEIIHVTASTSLKSWLDAAASAFNNEEIKSANNRPYYVQVDYLDAGEAVTSRATGDFQVDLWIPDNQVWVALMADSGENGFLDDCQSVAHSPLVIAMWQSLAEALGWPGRDLGWLDIGSLAADPSAWQYYSGGQYGDSLRLGHTHPGLSATGTSTLIAVVQAAQSQQEAIDSAAIQEPIVQASVSAFESSVTTFSRNTAELARLMTERGVSYLGAAIVYENQVFENRAQQPAIVPIYPFEGTFVADFPACLNGKSDEDRLTGATQFRSYLLSLDSQELAKAYGLRPVSAEVSFTFAEQAEIFINPTKPEIVFEQPSMEVVYAVQDLWQSSRKAVNLVMVIDSSGSMEGDKIKSVREAATEFVKAMGDGDFISILAFDGMGSVRLLSEHKQIGTDKSLITNTIAALEAQGGTPLYDSIGLGAQLIDETTSTQTSNALVVLTDGMDSASLNYEFNQELVDLATSHDTTIFTIAYGSDADVKSLEELAVQANGNFYLGDQANISEIYQEMSIIFGGSVGVGR